MLHSTGCLREKADVVNAETTEIAEHLGLAREMGHVTRKNFFLCC